MVLCLAASLAALAAFVALVAGLGNGSGLLSEAFAAAPVKPAAKGDKARPSAYVWSATRFESGIRLRGSAPSEEDRRTVLGMVKAHFPDLVVDDRLKIVAGCPPKEQWLGAVSFGLKQLAHLKDGSARLLNIGLKINGEARSAADYLEVKQALAGSLPTGLAIMGDDISPPAGARSMESQPGRDLLVGSWAGLMMHAQQLAAVPGLI